MKKRIIGYVKRTIILGCLKRSIYYICKSSKMVITLIHLTHLYKTEKNKMREKSINSMINKLRTVLFFLNKTF